MVISYIMVDLAGFCGNNMAISPLYLKVRKGEVYFADTIVLVLLYQGSWRSHRHTIVRRYRTKGTKL
jgi:hypothetical protein